MLTSTLGVQVRCTFQLFQCSDIQCSTICRVNEAKNMENSSNLPVGVGMQMRTAVIFDKKRSCSQEGDLEGKF